MKCEACGIRLTDGDEFRHRGHDLCTECVSELASWYLDGGMQENPEQFAWLGELTHGT